MLSNFLQPHIIYPTRYVKNAKPSLVDNFFSNFLEPEIVSGNLIDKISDHMPNFLIVPYYNKSDFRKNIKIRDYSNLIEENYINDISNLPPINTLAFDTNQNYEIFANHINNVINQHVPLRPLSKTECEIRNKPWLSRGLIKTTKNKTKFYKKYISTNNPIWFDKYDNHRKMLKKLIRISKTNYYQIF